MKKQKFIPGAIVRIEIDGLYHVYGRLLKKPYIEFYDSRSNEDQIDLEEVVKKPVLFTLCVYDDAVTKGRWKIVGKALVKSDDMKIPLMFMQKPIPPYDCSVIDAFGNKTKSSIDQCRGLERVAAWEPEHVEERLRDFYLGNSNRWVELLKLKEV